MGFVWKGFSLARDSLRGITIKPVNRPRPFEDLGPGEFWNPYSYSRGDLAFEFLALEYPEWRKFASYGNAELQLMHTATYILERPIQNGVKAYPRPLSSGEFQELKRAIRDGMLALVTRGGEYFRRVPDFRIEFIDAARKIPKVPSRPENPASVVAGSLNEGQLALGDNNNIEFVYEDYGAHDADKGITITRISKFEEITPDAPMPYRYSQGRLVFEFRASTYREWDGEKRARPHTATYVIDESIRQGATKANCGPLSAKEYQELRQNIKDGMWVAETMDGRVLDPHFRLEFVESANDAPRWPPRR
jgi:hypothetical protein